MSLPRTLDEYDAVELVRELKRRTESRAADKCDYCGRAPTTPVCRFPLRHCFRDLTMDEAQAAYDAAEPVPMTEEQIQQIVDKIVGAKP